MPDTIETIEKRTWTTWEELLLACAVKRHGLKDWDCVATELQMRSSLGPSTLTAKICETKYYDLRRRFNNPTHDRLAGDDEVDSVPWLEELRNLRVAELKQEVHRYDLSIQSLQLKVKTLQDERERSLGENDSGCEKPDLDKDLEEARSETDKKDGEGVPEKISSDGLAAKFVPDEDSDRRNRSSNESSSTENRENDEKRAPEPVHTGEFKQDPEPKAVKEDSCNDSSDTIAKQSQEKIVDVDSGELRDSAAESKEGMKEASDVQSSASLTKQRRRRGEVSCGGDDPVVVSPATTIIRDDPGKSESLVEFYQVIKSQKHGLVFERRLESQMTDRYKNVVRKHVDLEKVHARLDDGSYSSCALKFYLDILLVFTNAIAFFPKSSQESIAAHELRNIFLIELKKKRTEQSIPSSDSIAIPLQAKPNPESLLDKHKSSAPILVCRKRSSISSKATSANKLEKQADEKAVPTMKSLVKSSSSTPVEEDSSLKLKVKEKPVTGVRSMRRSSSKSSSPNVSVTNKNQITNSGATVKMEPGKTEKMKDATTVKTTMTKKRGAAAFLKRMKKNSPAKGTVVVETSKGLTNDVITSKREQKKKVEERREGTARKNAGGRQVKQESSLSKRSIGRPPKKERDMKSVKRGSESIQEAEGSSKRPKKRSRR